MEKEKILKMITNNSGKVTFKNLLQKINVGSEELQKYLLELKLDGQILQVGNKYRLFPNDLYLGSVVVSSSGKKYILRKGEKISVASNFFNNIILNDTVAYKVNSNNEAEIYSVVDRKLGKMTCEVKLIDGKKTIIPFRDEVNVRLDRDIIDSLFDGDIIVVNVTGDNIAEELRCEYIETIGRRDDPLIDDMAIALNYGFGNDYDEEYMSEVNALPTYVNQEETNGRCDFRNQNCGTIDGLDTKDMDDGVYAEMLDNGNIRAYVHIADVSHYIKWNSKIFERACEKTTSLYLNNSVFHMLHHFISNGICSLNPNVDRLAKTVIMEIDKDGNIVDFEIVKSVINSKKKMAYEEVDEILMNDTMVSGYESFEKLLYVLYDASVRLEKRYSQVNGKLSFASNELNKSYNDDGTVRSVSNRDNSVSRKIIENLMIAADECVANWFVNMDMLTVYRIHELPNISKVNMTISKLNEDGYKIKPVKDVDNPKALQKVLNILSGYEEYPIISQMLVRTMQRARYSVDNMGHYALGLPAYVHFTSPIRRLADLLVHTMIDLVLEGSDKITPEYLSELEATLRDLADHASKMERQAALAEEVSDRRQILKMLARNSNQEYEASIIELGKKVRIRVEGIETYVDSHELGNAFNYDSKKKCYYSLDNNHFAKVRIGTKVNVKVTSVDPTNDKFSVRILGNNVYKKRTKRK